MIVIGSITAIGLLLADLNLVIDFVDENGNILWKPMLLGITCALIGYGIYKFGEWLWSRD